MMAEREKYLKRIQSGRGNLLLMAVLTVANIVLMLIEAGFNFPFSALLPQIAVSFAQEFSLYYLETEEIICYVIAAVPILLFLLCWFLSEKRPDWLWLGLILFLLDTGVLAYLSITEFAVSDIIDLLFHAWVLFYLVRGVAAIHKLKELPEEEAIIEAVPPAL